MSENTHTQSQNRFLYLNQTSIFKNNKPSDYSPQHQQLSQEHQMSINSINSDKQSEKNAKNLEKKDNKIIQGQKKTTENRQFKVLKIPIPNNAFDDHYQIQKIQQESHENSSKTINLSSSSYPTTPSEVHIYNLQQNINCPGCGKNIQLIEDSIKLTVIKMNKHFRFHKMCYKKFTNAQISSLKNADRINQAKISSIQSQIYQDQQFCLNINNPYLKSFYAQLIISHPLTDIPYLHFQKRVALQNNLLLWKFNKNSSFLFGDQIICVPFTDFKVTLMIEFSSAQVSKTQIINQYNLNNSKSIFWHPQPLKYEFHIDFLEYISGYVKSAYGLKIGIEGGNGRNFYAKSFSQDCCLIEGEIIETKFQQEQIIERSKYKYDFKQSCAEQRQFKTPQKSNNGKNYHEGFMIKFNRIRFKVPQQYQNLLIHCSYYLNIHLNNNLTDLNYISQNLTPKYQRNTHFNQGSSNQIQNTNDHIQQVKYQQEQDPEFIQQYSAIFQALETGKISHYVSNNTGSRHVQKFLKKCSKQTLDKFIDCVMPVLYKLVICSYGNYVFQLLINVCGLDKKKKLIECLGNHLVFIAKTKQGTHALQSLVSTITLEAEMALLTSNIKQNALELSQDPHGTHFIQKIIFYCSTMNLFQYANFIIQNILQNFLEYVRDPNGILVLKTLFKQLKNQVNNQQIINKLIFQLTHTLQNYIKDPYGNYVVQEAFQWFGQQKMQSIKIKILQNFIPYAIDKYSSNVIITLLTTYKSNQFYRAAESAFLRSHQQYIQQLQKSSSCNHIVKLLYLNSQGKSLIGSPGNKTNSINSNKNRLFIDVVRTIFRKSKWIIQQTIIDNTPRQKKKEVQTVKVQNKSCFSIAVKQAVKNGDNNNINLNNNNRFNLNDNKNSNINGNNILSSIPSDFTNSSSNPSSSSKTGRNQQTQGWGKKSNQDIQDNSSGRNNRKKRK